MSLFFALMTLSSISHAACDDADALRVATVNAWGLPPPIARRRGERLPRIGRWLADRAPDIVGMQEMWRGALRLLSTPLVVGRGRGDSGLAIHSPHTITGTRLHAFGAERGLDAWKAKGVLLAEVHPPRGAVQVAVTHLQSGGGDRNAQVRADQITEILEFVGQGDDPLVLLGDFNFYTDLVTDTDSHGRLVRAGFVDVVNAAGADQGTYPGRSDRFDRVYVRSRCTVALSAEVVEGTTLSDHHLVQAEVAFRTTP